MRNATRRPLPRVRLTLMLIATVAACDRAESTRGAADLAAPPSPTAYMSTPGCAAAFTVITHTYDEVAAQFGPATSDDTVQVCETWTGSDYVWSFRRIGSSENYTGVPDPVQSTSYSYGTASASDASGAQSDPAEYVGATLFDFVGADQAQRQASYDDPYYGIRAMDTCNGTQFMCEPALSIARSTSASSSSAGAATAAAAVQDVGPEDGKFKKHGVRRRGVRALLEDREEIGRSKEGRRRFRKVRGDEVAVLEVDPATGLIVAEEVTRPNASVKAKHTWKRSQSGWVRDRTETEMTEVIDGRAFKVRSTSELRDVQIP